MTADLDSLLSKHSLVTFRFYAQHAGLPSAEAKVALQSYADEHCGVHTVYLVGGMRKVEGRAGMLEYKLVPDEKLDAAKDQFESLTACHAYSLHAAPVTSGEPLYILNHTQDRKLFDEARQLGNSEPTVSAVPAAPLADPDCLAFPSSSKARTACLTTGSAR